MAGIGSVAVIGAGMAGLACSRVLADGGMRVTVFDKGRGIGGRLATRRTASGPVDHGAVALTCHDGSGKHEPRAGHFAGYLQTAVAEGAAAFWPAANGWVGLPGMSGIVQPLARGLTVHVATEVTGLLRRGDGWQLQGATVPDDLFDQVIIAVPQPQAFALLAPLPALQRSIGTARMRAVWTAMVGFDQALPLREDLICRAEGPVAQAIRNATKPGRGGNAANPERGGNAANPERGGNAANPERGGNALKPERGGDSAKHEQGGAADVWVIHASADWTGAHLELDKPAAAALLLTAFFDGLGLKPVMPVWLEGHRWRYGLTAQPLGQPFVRDAATGMSICGDWCLGDTAQDAFASGSALAAAVLGQDGHA